MRKFRIKLDRYRIGKLYLCLFFILFFILNILFLDVFSNLNLKFLLYFFKIEYMYNIVVCWREWKNKMEFIMGNFRCKVLIIIFGYEKMVLVKRLYGLNILIIGNLYEFS